MKLLLCYSGGNYDATWECEHAIEADDKAGALAEFETAVRAHLSALDAWERASAKHMAATQRYCPTVGPNHAKYREQMQTFMEHRQGAPKRPDSQFVFHGHALEFSDFIQNTAGKWEVTLPELLTPDEFWDNHRP